MANFFMTFSAELRNMAAEISTEFLQNFQDISATYYIPWMAVILGYAWLPGKRPSPIRVVAAAKKPPAKRRCRRRPWRTRRRASRSTRPLAPPRAHLRLVGGVFVGNFRSFFQVGKTIENVKIRYIFDSYVSTSCVKRSFQNKLANLLNEPIGIHITGNR